MMNKCFIIVNPISGGYHEKMFSNTIGLLKQHSIEPTVFFTKSAGDATSITSDICKNNLNPFIGVMGGDGTINEVINGISCGDTTTIAVLPSGTANVLAKELGILNYKDALSKLLHRKKREVFICEIELPKDAIKRRFILMAGIGIDGEIVLNVRLGLKRFFGKYAYIFSAIKCLLSGNEKYLNVLFDGKNIKTHSVIICNASLYGGNFRLANSTDVFRPNIQFICMQDKGIFSYLKLTKNLLLNKRIDNFSFVTDRVTVEGNKAIQIDGDFFGFSPAKISISPLKLTFIV